MILGVKVGLLPHYWARPTVGTSAWLDDLTPRPHDPKWGHQEGLNIEKNIRVFGSKS